MITSAEEFRQLRSSEIRENYKRATQEEASVEVWNEILRKHPELAFWVAQNKTIQLDILEELARNPDPKVRCMVARKRKITDAIIDILKEDSDESVRYALICNTKIKIEQKMSIRINDSDW